MPRLTEDALLDVRYAARSLRQSPGFATLAILTLAIGIGANTAIFSVVNAALLRPLPFAEPDRLMKVALRMPRSDAGTVLDMTWSYPKYLAFRRDQDVFSEAALYIHQSVTIGGAEGDGERVPGESVSGAYLRVLGLRPVVGGDITWDDVAGDAPAALLLGYDYWRSRHGADPGVVGNTLEVDGRAVTVAGVLPPGFRGLTGRADLFLPIPLLRSSSMTQAGAHQYEMVTRRAQEATVVRAREVTQRLGEQLADAYPAPGARWGAAAYSFEEVRLDPAIRQAVIVVAAAVVLLLLIACVNLAGLLLGRAAERRREIATRLALGASRARIVRQLLTESLLLAASGAVAGLGLAWAGIRGLSRIVPTGAGEFAGAFTEEVTGLTTVALHGLRLDATALAFTATIAMLAAILFGVAPALQSIRTELVGPLRGGRSSDPQSGMRRLTPRNALVMAEVALAVVLLVGAGLVARSLGKLLEVPTGFDAADVLTARISLGEARFQQENAGAMWQDLLDRLRTIPGVDAVGAASCAPLSTDCEGTAIGIAPGDEVPVGLHGASPGYFRALRIPLLSGRDFSEADGTGTPRVLIVNHAAVETYWGGESPVGRRIDFWGDTAEVIGVVGDARYDRLEERPRPAVYVPFAQRPFRSAMVFIRGDVSTSALVPALRSELRGFGSGHALYDVRSMRERTSHAMARTSFIVTALGLFAGVALLLAAIGVYGVIALAVVQRRREIGIRMALGARAGAVVGMLVREGMALAVLGIIIGLLLAIATARLLEALLYGVSGTDLLTYGAIAGILALVTLAATYVPARGVLSVSIVEVIKRE